MTNPTTSTTTSTTAQEWARYSRWKARQQAYLRELRLYGDPYAR